ncbi:MAG TPA: mannose-6-phosphate isomerase [Prolixibacteraceae bacterium]|nr:MAG: mannose-6-phosphate isomerase [Bacteroidetes bacterium GWA2_42_15]HBL78428.1 mannose-6-phosphate isomerase [Prolixibacteraceae bacterium]HCR89327.1 mannose-6-phosphate isomerase [Prolixibacteraceae bacterium]HCU61352.1 mannose-6-phosphate isomerase [Prolixibacteraceae bacterium]
MESLYPLKFITQYKDKIWGGNKIKTILNKDFGDLPNCGETWEISAVEGNISVVANGYLAGNDLQELAEIYMGDLLGEKVYERFGVEFPLLIKFIDANDDLSIQVHPDDKLSKQRHNAYGKTEMWYVLQADKGAKLNSGFNQEADKEKYLKFLEAKKLTDILNFEEVAPGDVFFIPAGRVHAIGKGILLTEIQQTSDVTYRIYDYDRKDDKGNLRELHTELALDTIDFSLQENYKTGYEEKLNESSEIVSCDYFTTNVLAFDQPLKKDYNQLDSFVIYICLEGSFEIEFENGTEMMKQGETVLIPASLESLELVPISSSVKLLEVYIK